jgi:hypothetical protein
MPIAGAALADKHSQGAAFSRSIGPQEPEEFPLLQGQIKTIHGHERAVAHNKAVQFKDWRRFHSGRYGKR